MTVRGSPSSPISSSPPLTSSTLTSAPLSSRSRVPAAKHLPRAGSPTRHSTSFLRQATLRDSDAATGGAAPALDATLGAEEVWCRPTADCRAGAELEGEGSGERTGSRSSSDDDSDGSADASKGGRDGDVEAEDEDGEDDEDAAASCA